MKNLKLKRCAALLFAIIMSLILAACVSGKTDEPIEGGAEQPDGKLFNEATELSIVIGSHPSWPYDENFLFWKYFREAVGAKINVSAIPNLEFQTKLSLIMAAPDTLPDLIHMIGKPLVDNYAEDGAFVAIDDHLNEMPNYTRFWDSVPEDEREAFYNQRRSADGKIYFPPVYGNEAMMNLQVWMYRKDIFEKNKLTVPETLEDLYNVAVELKKLYPDSYPICIRDGLYRIDTIAPQFKKYFASGLYYDFSSETWGYGAVEPTMLEIVNYLNRLREEGLLPPDYLTINAKSWEELVSNDRGFMTVEYMTRIDFFNIPNRLRDPDYTMAVMVPPRSDGPDGQNLVGKFNMDPTGYVVCNTGKPEQIAKSIKLVDWMYSDEATELFSWGKENESYIVEDGKRKFLLDEGETATQRFGMTTYGLYQRIDPNSKATAYSEELVKMLELAHGNMEKQVNPVLWLALNPDEQREVDIIMDSVKSYTEEGLSKFLLGQESMSLWDSFQSKLREMGVDRLVEIYDSAYKRAIK